MGTEKAKFSYYAQLDRMHEISAENLLLQSDVADYHAELTELRGEAKDLRAKCYELIEDNRICKAEVRDLRRYIDLQKANKSGGGCLKSSGPRSTTQRSNKQ